MSPGGGWRSRCVSLVMLALFAALSVRVFQLASQLGSHDDVQDGVAVAAAAPFRGDIVDRRGEVLASTLTTFSLYADPQNVWDPSATAEALAEVLPGLDVERATARLSSDRRFEWLRRGLSPRQRQAVFDLGLAGLDFRPEPRRVYPRGQFAAHVLGFTNIDGRGQAGAERAFDDQLSSQGGEPVGLSIDIRAQDALEEELRDALLRERAKAAVGVVLNVRSGEVLALASMPDFDPNAPKEAPADARRNRAMASVFELGSVFKVLTFAAALDEAGTTDLTRILPTDRPLQVRGHLVRDPYPAPEPLSMQQAFLRSSNIAAAHLAIEAGAEAHQRYLTAFRLMEAAPIGYAESAAPLKPAQWREAERATLAYGYGLSVSPLAFAAAFSAAVNGGVYLTPTLRPADESRFDDGEQVLSSATSEAIRRLLRGVVVDGTGRRAAVAGYDVGGKTGTAEKAHEGGYDPDRIVSSFAAAFPIDNPQYAVLIVLDEPRDDTGGVKRAGGGHSAAPTAGRVIARLGVALGLPGDAELAGSYHAGGLP